MAGGRQNAFIEGRGKEATRGFVGQREKRPCFTVFGGFESVVEDLDLARGRRSQSEAELGRNAFKRFAFRMHKQHL